MSELALAGRSAWGVLSGSSSSRSVASGFAPKPTAAAAPKIGRVGDSYRLVGALCLSKFALVLARRRGNDVAVLTIATLTMATRSQSSRANCDWAVPPRTNDRSRCVVPPDSIGRLCHFPPEYAAMSRIVPHGYRFVAPLSLRQPSNRVNLHRSACAAVPSKKCLSLISC
jgi:hypothetical protein